MTMTNKFAAAAAILMLGVSGAALAETNPVATQTIRIDQIRASKLIGTEVVNHENQKLGTLRDLVVDSKSQRVAYAWIEKSDETGSTGKYVAVPLNFISQSTDQRILVLNADKSRFSSAHGYAKNQMPNMALSNSQLSFWQSIVEPSGAQPGSDQPK